MMMSMTTHAKASSAAKNTTTSDMMCIQDAMDAQRKINSAHHATQSPFKAAEDSSLRRTPNGSSATTQRSTTLMQCIKKLLAQLPRQDTLRRLTDHLCALMSTMSSNFPAINRVLDQALSNSGLVQKQAAQLDEAGRRIMSLEADIDDLHHERRQLMYIPILVLILMMSRRTDLADSNGVAERMFTANKELTQQCLSLEDQLWEAKAANTAMAADHALEMETLAKEMCMHLKESNLKVRELSADLAESRGAAQRILTEKEALYDICFSKEEELREVKAAMAEDHALAKDMYMYIEDLHIERNQLRQMLMAKEELQESYIVMERQLRQVRAANGTKAADHAMELKAMTKNLLLYIDDLHVERRQLSDDFAHADKAAQRWLDKSIELQHTCSSMKRELLETHLEVYLLRQHPIRA
ncbi:hypothetical protein DYB37_006803 [Aphanomyces astaci]|uniref:Uncharacterized protein n=1 Tax=Aphanomyces astaci TaxID=112090 RepID=A0A3R7C6G4_APHAT|nr:hypothetical protein DYB37_006803 [Aphanomyces astaci]